MALTEQRKESMYKYAKENLKRIPLDVQKEKYEEIKAAADGAGETVNGYIKKAIDSYNSFIVTIKLDKDISFNDEIFLKLDQILRDNSEYMNGFTRRGNSKGEFKLYLRFKKDQEDNKQIIQNVLDVLKTFNIQYEYEK